MKKTLFMALTILILISVISCSKAKKLTDPSPAPTATATNTPYHEYLGAFGGVDGTAAGQLHSIDAMCVDSNNNLYVGASNYVSKFDSNFIYQLRWGTSLTGDGKFSSIFGVSADSNGNIWVCDGMSDIITKHDNSNGNILQYLYNVGTGQGQFNGPSYIFINDKVHIVDYLNARVQTINLDMSYDSQFDILTGDPTYYDYLALAADSTGNIYTMVLNQNRIKKFDSSGNFVKKFDDLYQTRGMALFGNKIYATSYNNIRVYSLNGDQLYTISNYYDAGVFKTFNTIGKLAVDSQGNIYIAEISTGVCRVLKLSGVEKYN